MNWIYINVLTDNTFIWIYFLLALMPYGQIITKLFLNCLLVNWHISFVVCLSQCLPKGWVQFVPNLWQILYRVAAYV